MADVGNRSERRSRAGSHQTYGGWEPTVCSSCGRKLTLKDAAMCHYDHLAGHATTTCGPCLFDARKEQQMPDGPASRHPTAVPT